MSFKAKALLSLGLCLGQRREQVNGTRLLPLVSYIDIIHWYNYVFCKVFL